MKYIYGPVHSRRLGLSLGLSLTPHKTCNFDCVYCQLGSTSALQTERKEYVPVKQVYDELREWLTANACISKQLAYITISGCGEPTLNTGIGPLITMIKTTVPIQVAVITNASTFVSADVRNAVSGADLIVPSLDAADAATFSAINKPHGSISLDNIVEGLVSLRNEYKGAFWLEIMVVKGINDSLEQARLLKAQIDRIRPDKVQINSPVRSTAEKNVLAADPERLQEIKQIFGEKAEIV